MAASANPLILTCEGASSDAAGAETVADALAAAGLGTRARRPAADAQLIAVDGCAGACCSRRLESTGLRAAAVIDAAAIHTSSAAVAAARRQLEERRPRRRRMRRPPPSAGLAAHGAHSARDYLLALGELTAPLVDCGVIAPGLPALSSHVSQLLGVSRASAGEMLERLERRGLVTRTADRQVVLTDDGRAAADTAVRRQRILEVFAVQTLAYEIADSFEAARALDVAFDDEAIERLFGSLGSPDRCPHGWPVDPRASRAAALSLRTLATVEGPQAVTVVALSERPVAALRELAAAGLGPDARAGLHVRRRLSAAARTAAFVSTG